MGARWFTAQPSSAAPRFCAAVASRTRPLHRLIHAGDSPAPIQLGPRAVAWVESEVNGWIGQANL
ncbi:MAG: AlpA family phage regulatory protein [Halomonas sp.]|uniref:helix-turn-helix transcriptional regulator n=1 Tax=Halomonas sp. TaxID=1486246 RepID=UPI002ACE9BAC|nr:AlpA family phage regulatory protein [Halomonas sp.]MDZ7852012.1 AlpA family phage regulatory protein [Halomonas sp.]